ncbi:MAG: caspase family protein [Anaerolineae bacterium]|nr:caspase family protein [Anaerolineae bacterium]
MSDSLNKWALLVGINRYPHFPPWRQLKGCVNDVEAMAAVLSQSYGFPPEHITLLRNAEATRAAILGAMHDLLGRVAANDLVVLHYSGHGSQMTDREQDEADGKDETIVPHDSSHLGGENRDISDDEINAWLQRLTALTPYVTLIFDCCHSGTLSRDAFGAQARWVEPDLRPIEELPPSPLDKAAVRGMNRAVGASGWFPPDDRHVLIAGCADAESSYEVRAESTDGKLMHGALTYYLLSELAKATSGASYRDAFEPTRARVAAVYPHQHPQLEGAADRALFGVQHIETMRFLPLEAREGARVTLGGGAAHGLTVGSSWAIYPPGAKRPEEADRAGLVQVAAVGAVSSDATIVGERVPGVIQVGCRAIEEAHHHGDMQLAVALVAPEGFETAVNEVAALVQASPLLGLAEEGQSADVCVYLLAPRIEANGDDPVPQLSTLAQYTWAAVGREGRLLMPSYALADAEAASRLCGNLVKIARYRNALGLRNPNPDCPLKGQIDFVLKRQAADGTWAPASPDEPVVYEEGDLLAFELVNHYARPIYVSVLDFGLTYGVSLLYPPSGPSEVLSLGDKRVRTEERYRIRLGIPAELPPDEPGGLETLKLFATTHETDFRWLTQERVRPAIVIAHPLQRLFELAYSGQGQRDAEVVRVEPTEEWVTVERSFFLKRKPS